MSVDIKIEKLKKALESITPAENGWLVKLYKRDFKWLWELSDGEDTLSQMLDCDGSEHNLVIIWDSMPDAESDGINILDHLTPYDWALSFSYQQLREHADNLPNLRIIIVDLYSHHQANALSVKMLPAFCHAMPWMQVFRPLPLDNKYALTFCDLTDWAKKPGNNTLSSYSSRSALNQLEPVVDAWVGNVSRGSDHHAIANLIAPRLLLRPSEQSVDGQEPAKRALSRLVENLGLLPNKDLPDNLLSKDNPWIDWGESKWSQNLARLGKGKKLKLLVFDDQWKDGWGEVICKAVNVAFNLDKDNTEGFTTIGSSSDGKVKVKACGTADWLIDKGKPLSSTTDQRFNLQLDGEGEDWQEILFLDLRLFSRKTIKEEADFFQGLLNKARELNKKENLPWPSFTDDELCRVEAWRDNAENIGRESSAYHEALTLLPRIISLIDLSYPVILFSSTGQRKIVEYFKEYGNILTNFEKPRLTSVLPDNIALQTAEQFATVINKAVNILATRNICSELINTSLDTPVPELPSSCKYVELFIDESFSKEQNRVLVGGVFSAYGGENLIEANIKADKFDDKIVGQGVRYFDSLGIGGASHQILSKKVPVNEEMQTAMQKESDNPDVLGAIRISHVRPAKETVDILDPSTADNFYRMALTSLIELFLYEVLPQVIGKACSSQDTLLSIYVATRVKNYLDIASLDSDKYRFGFTSKFRDNKHLLYSIGRDSVFPVVADLLAARIGGPKIDRAIAVKLCYQVPGYDKSPTYPEYFVCRTCKKVAESEARKVFQGNDAKNLGHITHIDHKRGFGFLRMLNDSKDSIFHHISDWKNKEFSNAKVEDLIKYKYITQGKKRKVAKEVSLVSKLDAKKIESMETTVELTERLECYCEKPDFAPDYRALHYVADEVLSTNNFPLKDTSPYKELFKRQWVFADDLNDSLKALAMAGRNLDSGNLVDAIVGAASSLTSRQDSDCDIKRVILSRIGNAVQQIGGDEFIRISSKSKWPVLK